MHYIVVCFMKYICIQNICGGKLDALICQLLVDSTLKIISKVGSRYRYRTEDKNGDVME